MPTRTRENIVRKKEREEFIHRHADELAQSGKYQDWRGVEIELRHKGFLEARQLLDSRFRRQELNKMCHQAQKEMAV
jgi:hypothetical protein